MTSATPFKTQAATVDRLEVAAYTVPSETPESDGTLEWQSTTMVVVHSWSGEQWGMGYTYADTAFDLHSHDGIQKYLVVRTAIIPSATM
jgi:hypothetical protein